MIFRRSVSRHGVDVCASGVSSDHVAISAHSPSGIFIRNPMRVMFF